MGSFNHECFSFDALAQEAKAEEGNYCVLLRRLYPHVINSLINLIH